MNGTLENRVLGRVLAVEETTAVSGAKPTSPCRDNITAPWLGDSPCLRQEAGHGASAINTTGVMLDQEVRR